ncbi:MAG: hypothetical protein JNN33_18835, partial [Rhodospirillaceae bacterium]|nr:hypothetical protein [Rhodospirillaceae bacterium]
MALGCTVVSTATRSRSLVSSAPVLCPTDRLSAYAPAAPSPTDAPPAARLLEAGAVLLGKTTMPDLGCLASGISSQHGTARNPWNLARTPGGSTSGGAAAVAAGFGPLTIGSDLGGSVRIPAAFCGLVGLKPTQGRI